MFTKLIKNKLHLFLPTTTTIIINPSSYYSYSSLISCSYLSTSTINYKKEINKKSKEIIKKYQDIKIKKNVSFNKDPRQPPNVPIVIPDELEEWAQTLDTSITPEQRERVERIKKQIRGANPRHRSFETTPPTVEQFREMDFGEYKPIIPPNAEALIDFALSFIPERTGPRRTRRLKRLQHVANQRIHDHKRRIEQSKAAFEVKKAKKAKKIALMNSFRVIAGLEPIKPRKKAKKSKKVEETPK